MEESPNATDVSLRVSSYFIRKRNALITRGSFSDLFVDYYLHLAEHHYQQAADNDRIFKESLVALALHCASRPWNETIAWTLNFQNPLLNIFVHGSNHLGTLVGRTFTENVRSNDHNFFFSDIARTNQLPHRSSLHFDGDNAFRAAETYYLQSEQRLARYFESPDEEYILISAQPDCDLEWLEKLTIEQVDDLEKNEEFSLLEIRNYRWECGCTHEKMMNVLEPSMRGAGDALFGNDSTLRMTCPRCGARYVITRESMDALVKKK